jgi:TRAP-type C4-dicarboxylate transport system substrate-binding protein
MIEAKVEAKGFKILVWAELGWTYFFTKTPARTPEELKKMKLYSWEGDPPATEAFRKVGLRPVTVASTDVLPALQTGMLEGFPTSALSALALQWFGLAKNMTNLKIAPMVGATVISMKAWNKIPEELQPKVLDVLHEVLHDLNTQVLKLDEDAIVQMKKLGLQVIEPTHLEEWEAFGKDLRAAMRGSAIPPDAMDRVLELHREYLKKEQSSADSRQPE